MGSDGKVPSSQLPSYVDDVLEYTNKASFPTKGETGKIYVAKDTNLTYRWGGTEYVEISASLAIGETDSTAYMGSKGKANAEAIAGLKTTVSGHTTKISNLETSQGTQDTAISGVKSKVDHIINGTTTVLKSTASTTATKLSSARSFALTGDVTGTVSSDLSSGASIGATIGNGKVTSAKMDSIVTASSSAKVVTYNAQGRVTGGGTIIEFGTSSQNTPSADLVVGGLFFELQ